MRLFADVLEMISRGELKNPRVLLDIYKRIIREYIPATHLISYLNIYNVAENGWFSLPESENKILFYSERFTEHTVNEDWKSQRNFRDAKQVRSFRHYVFEKGERKYPILLITRDSWPEEPLYPDLNNILFQVPLNKNGGKKLSETLKLSDPADQKGFTMMFKRLKKHFSNWKYLYYYVTPIKRESAVTGVSIFTAGLIDREYLLRIVQLLDLISAHLDLQLSEMLLKNFSLRSAVAAIMSRNMSHNLGSHVLARIANRGVGDWMQNQGISEILKSLYKEKSEGKELAKTLIFWSKDAQILALYIQQRMDFIAQISSEWPRWSEPAYLLKNLMRGFLSQKHLLNFIAASENLGAHLFHEKRHLKNLIEYGGDIRFHIFLVPEKVWKKSVDSRNRKVPAGETLLQQRKRDIQYLHKSSHWPHEARNPQHSVLLYTPGNSQAENSVEEDILLAVPGGVVGYQAFYVILENIIRNAAKHGFPRAGADHLDIVIEILYEPSKKVTIKTDNDPQAPAWLVRIYDNVSFVKKKYSNGDVMLWGGKNGARGINDRLGTSVIQGGVKKEDWGLAEMKIAAGYLQGRSIEYIGKVDESITGKKILETPKGELDDEMLRLAESDGKEPGSSAIIRAVASPIETLGYEFYILQPQTVGIVFNEKP